MPHPFFDATQYPWHRPDAQELFRALWNAIADPHRIDLFYRQSGDGLSRLNLNRDPDLIWQNALDRLTVAKALHKLCDLVLAETAWAAIHPAVRAVVNAQNHAAAGGSAAKPAAVPASGRQASIDAASRILARAPAKPGHRRYLLRFQPRGPLQAESTKNLLDAIVELGFSPAELVPAPTDRTTLIVEIVVWAEPAKLAGKRERLRWFTVFFAPEILKLPLDGATQ